MIERGKIENLIRDMIEKKEIFIVSLNINPANKIRLLVDSMKGLQVQDCVLLSRAIEAGLDREKDDFELEVSSPGLDAPLKVTEQYIKNIGREVEVYLKDGSKHIGKLTEADQSGFKIEKRIKSKKLSLTENLEYSYDDINKVKVLIKI